jgi:riboflavin biosynthesis pyrimidine reductase
MRHPDELRSEAGVDLLAGELFGAPLKPARGVVHVTAVAAEGPARRVIDIGPAAPTSALDRFVLHHTRARVDAILVTGSVLRAEPELTYDLGIAPAVLGAWRAACFGAAPHLLVLSRGELPVEHPAWFSWARPRVLVPTERAEALARALPPEVRVVGRDDPSPRAALAYLREELGCRSVSVEAGPSVATGLYEAPCAIDELLLSVYDGPLEEAARGGRFLDEDALAASHERVADTRVGAWRFTRWLAR